MIQAMVFTLTTRFAYDGDGARRVVEVVGHGTTTLRQAQGRLYTLDYGQGNRVLAEETVNGTLLYLYGHDCLGQFEDTDAEDEWLYYLNDGIGYVRQGADAQGQAVSSWLFDPDGAVLEGPQGPVSHLICGGVYDWSTGLIFRGRRYFDPTLGIWLALAPLVVVQSWQGRKRRRRRGMPWYVVVLVVVCVGSGVLTACGPSPTQTPGDTPSPTACLTPSPIPTGTPVPPTSTSEPSTETPVPPTETPEPPTGTSEPPTGTPPSPTPLTPPEDCPRITSEAIAQAGGLPNYLQGESNVCTLTRVAMGESHENEEDRELIMWLIKIRADLGYGNGNSRGFNPPHDRWGASTSIKQEALNPGQFQNVEVAYPTTDPEAWPETGNIRAMLSPTDAQLQGFLNTYQTALSIVDLPISSAPEKLRGFDGFVADDAGVYWTGGKTSSKLAGYNAYYDQSWFDNIYFGLISCEYVRVHNKDHPLMDLQCPGTPTPSP
jgi:hypothetical protein